MKHSERVLEELEKLNKLTKELPYLGSTIMNAAESKLYNLDLVIIGIVKRCLSISSAFETLVKDWNMTCARALVRMQLDTVLRFSAFWISENPHEMAKEVISGKQINKMKDRDGNKMTDSYLARNLGKFFEWVPKVYEYTSGYIHFSERHLFDPIFNINEDDRLVIFVINDKDYKFPESSWYEIVKCFKDCLLIVKYWLEHYKESKEVVANK